MRQSILLLALLLAFVPGSGAATASDAADPCAVPGSFALSRPDPAGTPTEVAVGVYVIDVMEIDDAEQIFTADFYFLVRWRDPRLAADARGLSLAGCRLSRAELWHPRVDVVNQRALAEHLGDVVRIDDDGWVEYHQRFSGHLQAPLDVRDFPFDRQSLPITVASFGYSPEEVRFTVEERTGRRAELSVAGWSIELGESRFGTEYLPAVDRRLSRLDFILEARRHWGYYIWKMLVPLALIVFMAWTVFWIDPKHLAPQIGVSTATVFTLIAFQLGLGSFLPRVSYLTRADQFLLGSTGLVFLALGEAILTSKLADSGREKLSRRIDRWSRSIYPAVFALLAAFTLWI